MQASITTVLLLSQAGQSAKPYRVAVGSYCSINDGICSSAVYTLGFNPPGEDPHTQPGELTPLYHTGGSTSAADGPGSPGTNCTFVVARGDGHTFYCPNELGYGRSIPSTLRAFGQRGSSVKQHRFDQMGPVASSGGGMPPHMSLDQKGRFALVANYGTGTVASVAIGDGRAFCKGSNECPAASVVKVGGAPHSIYTSLDNKCALSPNIQLDRIYSFSFNEATGQLIQVGYVQVPVGTGPRHLAIVYGSQKSSSPTDPMRQRVYVLNEPSTQLTVWTLDSATCNLTSTGKHYSTLRETDNASEWHSAEVKIFGKHLYASNRFKCTAASTEDCNGTIATFEIMDDGGLDLVGHVDSGGHCPRVFDIDSEGDWMVVGNGGIEQFWLNGGGIRNIRVLKLDKSTGMPAAEASAFWEMGWHAPPATNASAAPLRGQGSPGGVAFL